MAAGLTRRAALVGGAAAVAGGGAWGLGAWRGGRAYDAMVARLEAPLPEAPSAEELVRYATLAANGHNTQPWRFSAGDGGITIGPDFARRTPVVDPDDHHLWASLGCAAETLRLAARGRGMAGEVAYDPAGEGRIAVDLTSGAAEVDARFAAIPVRQCTRSLYDGAPVAPDMADRLVAAARAAGAEALWVADPARVGRILDLVVEGNTRQIADPAFVAELKQWLRFNPGVAARRGDGLMSAASGNPSLPGWIGAPLFGLVFTAEAENSKYVAQVRSSAGIAVIVAPEDAPRGWVSAGRACQSLMLQATAEGLKCAFLNQATEVPELRAELQRVLAIGEARPSLILRVGRAPAMPRAPRRPVAEVLA
jgi:nitroreductase